MNDREEIDWLAFQYISEELDDASRRDFERRLEQDQAAREGVARAWEVAQCVRVVESERAVAAGRGAVKIARNRRTAWQHGFVWAGIAAAICLVVAWSMRGLPGPWSGAESPDDRAGVAGDVAVIWSEMQDMDEPAPAAFERPGGADTSEFPAVDGEALENGEPSYWVQVAVFGLAVEADEPATARPGGT